MTEERRKIQARMRRRGWGSSSTPDPAMWFPTTKGLNYVNREGKQVTDIEYDGYIAFDPGIQHDTLSLHFFKDDQMKPGNFYQRTKDTSGYLTITVKDLRDLLAWVEECIKEDEANR